MSAVISMNYNSQLSCHFNCTSLTGMCFYQFNMLKTIKKNDRKVNLNSEHSIVVNLLLQDKK